MPTPNLKSDLEVQFNETNGFAGDAMVEGAE